MPKYDNTTSRTQRPLGSLESQQVAQPADSWFIDDTLYFTDEYIDHLVKTGQKNLIVLVSSWSESIIQHARSINLGSRQCRDLVHHILLAQRLKQKGIRLEIKYFAFDNTKHFNYKNPKATDNVISKAYIEYVCSFLGVRLGVDLDEDQFQPIYLNPRFNTKEGDYTSAEFPDEISRQGQALFCSGPNAKKLEALKDELAAKKRAGHKILGMTVHSGGPNISQVAEYLGTELIGMAAANQKLGTKPGNKELFMEEPVSGGIRVPIAHGTIVARKNLEELYNDCYKVAVESGARRLVVKLTSSSAGNGNAFVDLSECFNSSGALSRDLVRDTVKAKIESMGFVQKIQNGGAIVEERLEGENITSPGVLAVVTKEGKVKILYKYDQELGDGNFFAGSIGPTLESKAIQDEMDRLTVEIGKRIHRRGGYGYFGLDFFTREVIENGKKVKKVDIIEANIRKTGTLYPWLSALHLLGEDLIHKKTISQDDKIELPLKMSDLTGRRDMKNLYMSGLYNFLTYKSATKFNHDTKTGAFVTFNTNAADKIGVVFIGNDRAHIERIKAEFKAELHKYTYEEFIPSIARNNPACQDLASLQESHQPQLYQSKREDFKQQQVLTTKPAGVRPSQLQTRSHVASTRPAPQRDHLGVAGRRSRLFADRVTGGAVGRFTNTLQGLGTRIGMSSSTHTTSRTVATQRSTSTLYRQEITRPAAPKASAHHDTVRTQMTISPNISYGEKFVFGIFGRTNSNNDLLIEAAKQRKLAYRFTPDSEFWFDRKTRKGKIRNVHMAFYDKATNEYKVQYIDNHWFDLPTVVYNYDFTATRRGAYQAQGDRTISDKVSCIKSFMNMIGAVTFNSEKEGTAMRQFLPATRSQLALYNLCEGSEDLEGLYPETQSITGDVTSSSQELEFINKHQKFYIKPGCSERKLDANLGNIFVTKYLNSTDYTKSHLLLTYTCRSEDGDYYSKTKRMNLSGLTVQKFLQDLNVIKGEMGYEDDEQFILQEYLKTPEVKDRSGKSLTKKIRVVTQRTIDPETGEVRVRASSIYGLYGGPNSHQGYLGDPGVYIESFLASGLSGQYRSSNREQEVYSDLFARAVDVHNEAEKELGHDATIGEAVVDFILTENGPVPIKIGTKPERADLNAVQRQTHLGQFLEGTRDDRINFIDVLEKNQNERNQRVLSYAERALHKGKFTQSESLRKRSEVVGSQRVVTHRQPVSAPAAGPMIPAAPARPIQQAAPAYASGPMISVASARPIQQVAPAYASGPQSSATTFRPGQYQYPASCYSASRDPAAQAPCYSVAPASVRAPLLSSRAPYGGGSLGFNSMNARPTTASCMPVFSRAGPYRS